MSSSSRPERLVAQDYIVRIRYQNQLPPPPIPPKLLDVPGTGLEGGQYTSAGYASRLAREQPLNIEADAELGMPIDLIGMPGVFDGDEKSIMARPGPQSLDPKDRALLKPLSALNKSSTAQAGVSFLRRTEYISSQGPQHFTSSTSKDLLRLRQDPKRRKSTGEKDEYVNIMRNIVKGFDIAHPKDAFTGEDSAANLRGAAVTDAEIKAWAKPWHPTKPDLELLDSYPVLPDLDAIPSTGFYTVVKFITNPVAESDNYDERLNAAIFRPLPNPDTEAKFSQKLSEWDPNSGKPQPIPEYDYDYYLPEEAQAIRGIKRKLNPNDPDNNDPELYSDDIGDGTRAFRFPRIRTYETYQQTGDPDNCYNDSIGIVLHDSDTEVGAVPGAKKRLSKGAYFYPVVQRTGLRPKRKVGALAHTQLEAETVDEIVAIVGNPTDDEVNARVTQQAQLDPSLSADAAVVVEATA